MELLVGKVSHAFDLFNNIFGITFNNIVNSTYGGEFCLSQF